MNRFELNVAYEGQHHCRVMIPETIEQFAVIKTKQIAKSFGAAYECTLTCWVETGRRVNIID